jgi:Na+/H+ antiporter NhaB
MNYLILFFACAVSALLGGCAGSPIRTQVESGKNRSNLLRLNVGMSKSEVLTIMGEPYKTEVYKASDERAIEFWLFLTEATTPDNLGVGDRNLTPLAFEKGKLEGWGRNYYNSTLQVKQDVTVRKYSK